MQEPERHPDDTAEHSATEEQFRPLTGQGLDAQTGPGGTKGEPVHAPLAEMTETRTKEALLEQRLSDIWAAAHHDVPGQSGEWKRFLESMKAVVNIDEELSERQVRAAAEDERIVLGRDVDTISLQVSAILERLTGPALITSFIRGSLTEALERLEATGEGTREERVDIIVRALRPVRSAPGPTRLAADLFRYLRGEPTQTPDYLTTVLNLANLASSRTGWADTGLFLLHYALQGMWRLVGAGELASLEGNARTVVRNGAYNSAVNVARYLQRQRQPAPADAQQVLENLATVAVVAASPLAADEHDAATVLSSLGLGSERAVDTLTVLAFMGGVPSAWAGREADVARLQASSAPALALGRDSSGVPNRLFNAGVSMVRSEPRTHPPTLRGRLLVNALGLRWSLRLAGDLLEALTDFSGLDCAVNFLGAAVDYWEVAPRTSDERGAVEGLARRLAGLPRWAPLQSRRETDVDVGRLASSARRLEIEGDEAVDAATLVQATERAIDGLRLPREPTPAGSADFLLDTARLVAEIFDEILGQPQWGLWPKVQELVQLRDDPLAVLRQRYAGYAAATDGAASTGPFVAAGMIAPREWQRLASQLLPAVDTIVPALERFSLE